MHNKLTTLVAGLGFGESPRWHDGRLWVADWAAHELLAIDPDGNKEVMLQASFAPFTFSIDWLPDGRLLIVSGGEQPLLRQEADGSLVSHVDSSDHTIIGPNEIVISGGGDTYVNCVGFNLMAGEAPKPGFVVLVTPDGAARRVADGLMFPNGMAITADDRTLIVAESYANQLTAYDIMDNGDLTNRRVWAHLGDYHPDGICLDVEGNAWVADVASGHCIQVQEGGTILQTIEADRGCFACMLGGEDGKKLFMVTNEWKGSQAVSENARKSQVVWADVAASHAGKP